LFWGPVEAVPLDNVYQRPQPQYHSVQLHQTIVEHLDLVPCAPSHHSDLHWIANAKQRLLSLLSDPERMLRRNLPLLLRGPGAGCSPMSEHLDADIALQVVLVKPGGKYSPRRYLLSPCIIVRGFSSVGKVSVANPLRSLSRPPSTALLNKATAA